VLSSTITPALNKKKFDELWFTNTRDYAANVYLLSFNGVCFVYVMHLSAGLVTLLPGEFHSPP